MARTAFAPWARAKAALRHRVHEWTRRRQGEDGERIALDRRRIYILPTRLGVGFAVMVFAMLGGGLNYGNNLAIALGLLLGSLGLVAMHHCHGNLLGLTIRLAATEPAFAGGRVGFQLLVDNPTRAARPRVGIEVQAARGALRDVPAQSSVPIDLELPARRRGTVHLRRLVIATTYPFGLFRAWSVGHPDYVALAYPALAPAGLTPPGVLTDTGGAQDHQGRGDDDFAGLQPFQPGDSMGRIAWKAHARGLGLHTKRYAGTSVVSHVFDWESLPGLPTEPRLSLLTRWIVDAHARGDAYGLRMPGVEVAPNVGRGHRQQCLGLLATHGDSDALG